MTAIYVIACLLFYLAFKKSGLVGRTATLLADFRASLAIMTDTGLSDVEKESRIQKAAIALAGDAAVLIASLFFVLAVAATPVILGVALNFFAAEAFVAFSIRPFILVGTIVALLILEWILRVLTKQTDESA